MNKLLAILVFVLVGGNASAQLSKKYVHQLDVSGKYRSIRYKQYKKDYPKIYDFRVAYMPTVVLDSSISLSAIIGFERNVSNYRNTLNYMRIHTALYGVHIGYQFRRNKTFPFQVGTQFSLFNDFVYVEDNRSTNTYEQNGYETALYFAPVVHWSTFTILPKISLVYRERSKFQNFANEANLYTLLGCQIML